LKTNKGTVAKIKPQHSLANRKGSEITVCVRCRETKGHLQIMSIHHNKHSANCLDAGRSGPPYSAEILFEQR